MSDDLRWSDCDELAFRDPIACLLCRTSKLNDAAHATAERLDVIETDLRTAVSSRNRWGVIASVGAVIGVGTQITLAIIKALHGG